MILILDRKSDQDFAWRLYANFNQLVQVGSYPGDGKLLLNSIESLITDIEQAKVVIAHDFPQQSFDTYRQMIQSQAYSQSSDYRRAKAKEIWQGKRFICTRMLTMMLAGINHHALDDLHKHVFNCHFQDCWRPTERVKAIAGIIHELSTQKVIEI